MKPKRFKPEFAVQAWVEEESRRFRPPDLDTLPVAAQAGGGGGAPTIGVAPVDASDATKEKAEFHCTGTNDDDMINEAIGSIPRGRIWLGEGTFSTTASIDLEQGGDPNVRKVLYGMGHSVTRITSTAATVIAANLGDTAIRHLAISGGTTGIEVTDDGVVIEDCMISSQTGIRLASVDLARITSNLYLGGDTAVTGTGLFVLISNNYCAGGEFLIYNEGDSAWVISGNILSGNGIRVDTGGNGQQISNNIFDGGQIWFNGANEGSVVQGNLWPFSASADSFDGVIAFDDGAQHVLIDGNVCASPGMDGIVVVDGLDVAITNNLMGESPDTGIVASGSRITIEGNHLVFPGVDGVSVVGDDCLVSGNYVLASLNDNYSITGDRNHVHGNYSVPAAGFSTADIGINIVSGNDNAVYANYLGDASAYGTADFADAGTGTMTAPGANGQFGF